MANTGGTSLLLPALAVVALGLVARRLAVQLR
jgi:hypothetical protein